MRLAEARASAKLRAVFLGGWSTIHLLHSVAQQHLGELRTTSLQQPPMFPRPATTGPSQSVRLRLVGQLGCTWNVLVFSCLNMYMEFFVVKKDWYTSHEMLRVKLQDSDHDTPCDLPAISHLLEVGNNSKLHGIECAMRIGPEQPCPSCSDGRPCPSS